MEVQIHDGGRGGGDKEKERSRNLLSKGSTFSILRRGVGAGVGGATTLGPDLGGGHSASIEPGESTAFQARFGCMLFGW